VTELMVAERIAGGDLLRAPEKVPEGVLIN